MPIQKLYADSKVESAAAYISTMADSYMRACDTLQHGTWLAAIPGDLLRVIRKMYPQSYTFERMRMFAKCARRAAFCQGSHVALHELACVAWQPQFREFLLYCEARKINKLAWWRNQYSWITYHSRREPNPDVDDMRELCLQMYDADFWNLVKLPEEQWEDE